MTKTRVIICAALGVCAWLTACGPNWYSIILTPQGPVMERKISQRFGPEELERVAVLYGQEIDPETLAKFDDAAKQKTSLTGTFGTDMPADSHNSGTYLYCDSPLGSAALYTERFGGRHDLAAMLREQERSFNIFWDLVLLQLDAVVGTSADYPALRSFLDTTMRADMWDLALELTVSDLGKDSMSNLSWQEDTPDDAAAIVMRALHFLDDRGYVTLRDALDHMAGSYFDNEDWRIGVRLVGKAIGQRMGMDEGSMPAAFAALADYPEKQLEKDLDRFRNTDVRVLRILGEFRKNFDGMSVTEPSSSMEALLEQALLFDLDLLDLGGDARDVTLYIPVKPYRTNGAWFEASEPNVSGDEDVVTGDSRSYVEWQYPLASVAPAGDLAQVVFAFWAEPAEDYQVEHFGFRVLSDEALADQCRWRRMLGPSLREEWDRFVAGLRPGPDLDKTLRRFRFSIEELPDENSDPNAIDSRIARDVVHAITSSMRRVQSQD